MSALLFYENPVVLNSRTHLNLRIKPSDDGLRFTNKANSVLLAGAEFPDACKHFPIVFAKGTGSLVAPIALLGFRERENLFVDSNGRWQGEYVPAYIRRYPFVLAQAAPGNGMTVCIDEAYPGFGADEGQPLFNAKGEATDYLKRVLAFLQGYQVQYERTERFVRSLVEMNLLMDVSANVNLAGGEKYALGGFQMVDERKLLTLPDDKVLRLFRAGELSWIYSHLISIGNFARLPAKTRLASAPATAAEKSTASPAEKPPATAAKPVRKK
jgi:hypothetical protein